MMMLRPDDEGDDHDDDIDDDDIDDDDGDDKHWSSCCRHYGHSP